MSKPLEDALLNYVEIDPDIPEPWAIRYELVVVDDYTNDTICRAERFDMKQLLALAPEIDEQVAEYIDQATEQVL